LTCGREKPKDNYDTREAPIRQPQNCPSPRSRNASTPAQTTWRINGTIHRGCEEFASFTAERNGKLGRAAIFACGFNAGLALVVPRGSGG